MSKPLIKKISDDLRSARFDRNTTKINLLSTLYSESSLVGKDNGNRESTNVEVVNKIRSFIKSINETILRANEDTISKLQYEKSILTEYLPKQLSSSELQKIIVECSSGLEKSMKSMGMIMKKIKDKYSGQFDGKIASNEVKNYLRG